MKLADTVQMMVSEDYKERFKAEYYQLVVRRNALWRMLGKLDEAELDFTPVCPTSTYALQLRAMEDYLAILKARAVMEGIELCKDEDEEVHARINCTAD